MQRKTIKYLTTLLTICMLFNIKDVSALRNSERIIMDFSEASKNYESATIIKNKENNGAYVNASPTFKKDMTIKWELEASWNEYIKVIGIQLGSSNEHLNSSSYYSKEQVENDSRFEIVEWTDHNLKIIYTGDFKQGETIYFGEVYSTKKNPDKYEVVYGCKKSTATRYNALTGEKLANSSAPAVCWEIEKRSVDLDSRVALIENNQATEYKDNLSNVNKKDIIEVKLEATRPVGIKASRDIEVYADIPLGFELVENSITTTTSDNMTTTPTTTIENGVPVWKFTDLPVGEKIIMTYRLKATEKKENVKINSKLINLYQKNSTFPSILEHLDPTANEEYGYKENEYTIIANNIVNQTNELTLDSDEENPNTGIMSITLILVSIQIICGIVYLIIVKKTKYNDNNDKMKMKS